MLRDLAAVGSRGWIMDRLNETAGPRLNRNMVIGKLWRLGLKAPEVLQHTVNPRVYHRRREAAPKPKPLPRTYRVTVIAMPAPVNPQPFLAIAFGKLDASRCKYPHGHGGESDPFLFCGQAVWGDGAYCEYHCRLCHVGPVEMPTRRAT